MARKRASMREGPLAELFRATEAAQRAQREQEPEAEAPAREPEPERARTEPGHPVQPELPVAPEDVTLEATVEHVYDFDVERPEPLERRPAPVPAAEPEPEAVRPAPVARGPEPAVVPAPTPEPEREVEHEPVVEPYQPPASRFVTPMPESAPRLHVAGDVASYLAVIRVVGVGGAGINAVNRMMDAGIAQVDFVAVNTDAQQLELSDAPAKIHIGQSITQGLGSGSAAGTGAGRRSSGSGRSTSKS